MYFRKKLMFLFTYKAAKGTMYFIDQHFVTAPFRKFRKNVN